MPFGIWAAVHIPIGSADVHQWLPEGQPARQRYEDFIRRFGSDQVLMASWEGATLDDPRLEEYEKTIQQRPEFELYFDKIVSPRDIVQSMEEPPWQLARNEASDRLRGVLIGRSDTTALLLSVSDQGVAQQRQTIDLVRSVADQVPGLGREKLRLVGTVYESFAVDEAAEASLKQLVLPSTVLGLMLCWFCFGRLRSVFVVMLLAGIGQIVMVAMVYYSGYRFSAVLIVLPTLVFMLTLSGAVHLMNYFLEHRASDGGPSGLAAFATGWRPCTLSSLTTALGMASLVTSQLFPVRQFGFFAALGLLVATVILLVAFPALSDWVFGFKKLFPKSSPEKLLPALADAPPPPTGRWMSIPNGWIRSYANLQSRFAVPIVICGFLILVFMCVGLSQLRSSTKFCDMFPENHRTHTDMTWFENEIGPIASVEILLRFPDTNSGNILDHARVIQRVSNQLKVNDDVGGVLSLSAFLPKIPDAKGVRATTLRSIIRNRIEENTDRLTRDGLLYRSGTQWVWRVMAKVSAISDKSYGELTSSVSQSVATCLAELGSAGLPTPEVETTGLSPVMHETQVTILSDLGSSFLSAFLLITPMMMITVRSFLGGLWVMIPNVLPVTIAFGCMGWMGWSLDIAGILTASIALGIAVDDTLHFVCWYAAERRGGCMPKEAIERTLSGCCPAMIHTTLISCGAMVPFLFAGFVPTQQFAILMVCMLCLALLCDLILLPAILLSPIGRSIAASASPKNTNVLAPYSRDGYCAAKGS